MYFKSELWYSKAVNVSIPHRYMYSQTFSIFRGFEKWRMFFVHIVSAVRAILLFLYTNLPFIQDVFSVFVCQCKQEMLQPIHIYHVDLFNATSGFSNMPTVFFAWNGNLRKVKNLYRKVSGYQNCSRSRGKWFSELFPRNSFVPVQNSSSQHSRRLR